MIRNLLGRLFPPKPESRDPGRVDALYEQGAAAFRAGRYAEAASCAESALALDPSLPAVHFLLGSTRFEMGEFEAAEAAFAACAKRSPPYPMVLHARMRAACARARVDLARGRRPQALPLPSGGRRVSVIICSITPSRFEKVCASYRSLLEGVPHEIIGIHDARSLCEGYNRGIRRANGDVLVFSHDDVEIVSPDFAARLLGHLENQDLVGIAGTNRLVSGNWISGGWPHLHGQVGSEVAKPGSLIVTVYQIAGPTAAGVESLDGVFLAARRELVERIAFDETTFDGWHLYDLDFSLTAHAAGFRTAVCNDLCLIHDSIGTYNEDWQRYARRFEEKHRERLRGRGELQPTELCWIEPASREEWLLMTEEMTRGPG
jgi:tetratricopeptide (TPR) repeat protein